MICKDRAFVLQLAKKDFSEILYYRKVEQQGIAMKFLLQIPFVKTLPYHIS